ncbi:DUF7919 family protein [Streptomyces sp. NPDC001840]
MTYFPDLSRYVYDESAEEMLNIGWLGAGYEYRRGIVADCVIEALRILLLSVENQTRGYHQCEFCGVLAPRVEVRADGKLEKSLGSAEIHVVGRGGVFYSAPDMILHYVLSHEYCPPVEFCRAVVEQAGVECGGDILVLE